MFSLTILPPNRKVPILAGGVVTGDQLVAALALGAEGVAVGTVFLATECQWPSLQKQAIVDAKGFFPLLLF
jgi:enoyl-[acyl-carrier protein] reductase II